MNGDSKLINKHPTSITSKDLIIINNGNCSPSEVMTSMIRVKIKVVTIHTKTHANNNFNGLFMLFIF